MPITQRELAQRLGMSRQIVGHALNGNPRVSQDTRRRVEEAARESGYSAQSNQDARNLIARRYGKRVRHDLIAVIMSGDDQGGLMRDMPYFAPIFRGIEEKAAGLGVDVALHVMRLEHMPRYIRESRVDGVIGLVTTAERNQVLYQNGMPLLTFGSDHEYASSLMPDDYRGIQLTTSHLVELGHRRIAYLGQEAGFPVAETRLNAFRDCLRGHGLEADEGLIEATLLRPYADAGSAGMEALWRRGPDITAVVCYNDNVAMGAIDYLRSIGVEVPRGVSITGFDDVSIDYKFEPAITSIAFDRHAMGRRSVAVFYELFDKIQENGPDAPLPTLHEVFPVKLTARDSTAAISISKKARIRV